MARRYSKLDKTIHDLYGVGVSKRNIHRSLNSIMGRHVTMREVERSIGRTHAHWNNKREFDPDTGQSVRVGSRNKATNYRNRLLSQETDKEKRLLNQNFAKGKFFKHHGDLRDLNAQTFSEYRPLSETEYIRDTGS